MVKLLSALFCSSLLSSTRSAGPSSELSWVFQTNSSLGYCHMSMIEPTGAASVVAAWQGAKVHEG